MRTDRPSKSSIEGMARPAAYLWIPFGKLGRPHGVNGALRLWPHNPQDALPTKVRRLRVTSVDGAISEQQIQTLREIGRSSVVTLDGVADVEAARLLTGAEVSVHSSEVPEADSGHFYLHALLGATVVDESEATLGTVQEIFDHGAQQVLVLDHYGAERLYPCVPETILRFEAESGCLRVRTIDGLWE